MQNSWYHALQVSLRKQFSDGMTFQLAYTYSIADSNTTFDNNLNNVPLQWAPQTFDRKQRLVVNYIYDVPSPIKDGNRKQDSARVDSDFRESPRQPKSELPNHHRFTRRNDFPGTAATSTGFFCSGMSNANVATSGQRSRRELTHWFNNPGVFCAPTPYPVALGGDGAATGYGNSGQGIVTGPGQFNWDISLGKMTHVGGIREDGQLQFRTEFYNAFNHPQFGNPGTAFSSSATFGVITATSVAPRLIQFGLKYIF